MLLTSSKPATLVGFFLLLTLLVLFPLAEVHAFGVGLFPTRVETSLKAGSRSREVITIKNVATAGSVRLSLGVSDWTMTEGRVSFSAPGSDLRSASGWVQFSPAAMVLGPGESKQVLVDIYVPAKLRYVGDYRFAVIASTVLPPKTSKESAGVWSKYQIASLFYCTIGKKAESTPIVSDIRVGVKDEVPQLSFILRNTGNSHARVQGSIVLMDEHKKTISQQSIEDLVVLEGQSLDKTISFNLDGKLGLGDYTFKLDLDDIYNPDQGYPAPVEISSDIPTLTVK